MLLIYLLLAGAFALGWIMRGWIALRDIRELELLQQQVIALAARDRGPTQDWARRQGLLP